MGPRGKNRLRLQKLNIALYPSPDSGDQNPINIDDIVISATQELNDVSLATLPENFKCGAIFVNQGEHAYAKVRFDKDSIDWITDHFMKIENAEDRGAIWRHLQQLVIDQ